jgi:hypothetical protein
MKVFLKTHNRSEIETVACCDEDLINKVFKEGQLKIEISSHFFGGNLINLDDAVDILKHAPYFNIVGKNIIKKAIDCKILHEGGVRSINGIPMAMKMMF